MSNYKFTTFGDLFIPTPKLNKFRLLQLISENPQITQKELAETTNLSISIINIYMKQMVKTGLLKYESHTSKTIDYFVMEQGYRFIEQVYAELLDEVIGMAKTLMAEEKTEGGTPIIA